MPSFDKEQEHEQKWMTAVNSLLQVESEKETGPIMWSSYHASRADVLGVTEKCNRGPFTTFVAKQCQPGMIRHGMELVKTVTEHLNPQQIPVMVVDQPLFDIAKKVQWTFQKSWEKITSW